MKDIRPAGDSHPTALTAVGDTLFFVDAWESGERWYEPGSGELWKSDGTAQGTLRVKDIRAGDTPSFPKQLTEIGGVLYFTADDGINGRELWRSDGTEDGTYLVIDLWPGKAGSTPTNLTNIDGELWFSAQAGAGGVKQWKSDGTAAGTVLIDSPAVAPRDFLLAGSAVYFSAWTASTGRELWSVKTDAPMIGDVNHDGVFNSADLVRVFQAGEYEDGIVGNSVFEEGDWNGDGEFDSSDLVLAFQAGNYVNATTQLEFAAAVESLFSKPDTDRSLHQAAKLKLEYKRFFE